MGLEVGVGVVGVLLRGWGCNGEGGRWHHRLKQWREGRERVRGICGASQLSGVRIHYQIVTIDLQGASSTIYKTVHCRQILQINVL